MNEMGEGTPRRTWPPGARYLKLPSSNEVLRERLFECGEAATSRLQAQIHLALVWLEGADKIVGLTWCPGVWSGRGTAWRHGI